MKQILVMMIGLPRSGKSTLARELGEMFGFPRVCPDAIRLALHGKPFLGESEDMVWVMARYMVRALFCDGYRVVILDSTNITKKNRLKWNNILPGVERVYIELMAYSEKCIARCEDDNLKAVIRRMEMKYERPNSHDELILAYEKVYTDYPIHESVVKCGELINRLLKES